MEPVVKINGKKIELVKWVAMVWFTITIMLLGFAVSWGVNANKVAQLHVIVEAHDTILRGVDKQSGLIVDVQGIKRDVSWMRKIMEVGNKNEEN